jgi:hypothetical protein
VAADAGRTPRLFSIAFGPARLHFSFGEREAMKLPLPISAKYDSPIYEALAIQIILGLLSFLILDGGAIAQICGIALVAFWGGAAVLIWRHPQSPSKLDLSLVRVGYLPVIAITIFLAHWVWHLRGIS